MKTSFCYIVIAFLLSAKVQAQDMSSGNLLISTDAKVLLFGSDNQYTQHPPVGNFLVLVEVVDKSRHHLYAYLGFKYVNLNQYYYSGFTGFGTWFSLRSFDILPSFEAGLIRRERRPVDSYDKRPDTSSLYCGASCDIRFNLSKYIAISARPNIELATDLPNRLLRYQSTVGIVLRNIF